MSNISAAAEFPTCSHPAAGSEQGQFRLQKWSRNSYLNVGEDVAYRSTSMAPARPFWKGYLKLSLVSCPIALFPASSSSERVSFRQISKKTGHRLKQQPSRHTLDNPAR